MYTHNIYIYNYIIYCMIYIYIYICICIVYMIVYVIYIYTYTYTHLTTTRESDVLTPFLGFMQLFRRHIGMATPQCHSKGHNTWAIFSMKNWKTIHFWCWSSPIVTIHDDLPRVLSDFAKRPTSTAVFRCPARMAASPSLCPGECGLVGWNGYVQRFATRRILWFFHIFCRYPLVMTNSLPWYRWPIYRWCSQL